MRFDPATCPTCGGKPRGTVEQVPGLALLMELTDQPGEYDYEGYTEVWWDSQVTSEDAEGNLTLMCAECGEDWQATMTPTPQVAKVGG